MKESEVALLRNLLNKTPDIIKDLTEEMKNKNKLMSLEEFKDSVKPRKK